MFVRVGIVCVVHNSNEMNPCSKEKVKGVLKNYLILV